MPGNPSPELNRTISQFEKLLANLATSGVDFAVAGGVAVILNGYPRTTLDLDILVHDDPSNIQKLLECLKAFGQGYARELVVSDFLPAEGSIRVSEEFDLDIFTRMRGRSLVDFKPTLRTLLLGSAEVQYLDPASLILLKKDSWREKDQIDTLALREILRREHGGNR